MLQNLSILGRNVKNYKELNSSEKTLSLGRIKYRTKYSRVD